MSGWTPLTVETVLNALPTDMGNLYRSWIDANPAKTERLGEIVAETVNMFREAVAVYPWYVMDPDITMVPVSGFRHNLAEPLSLCRIRVNPRPVQVTHVCWQGIQDRLNL